MTGEEAGGALVSVMSGEYCQINILNIINICIYICKHNDLFIKYYIRCISKYYMYINCVST